MPTYVHTDDAGQTTERVVTEPGSLADLGYADKIATDGSGWSVLDETAAAELEAETPAAEPAPAQAPAGRAPQSPAAKKAAAASGESSDG